MGAQRRLARAVHRRRPGVRLFAQISHAGLNTSSAVTGQELVSASSLRTQGGISRALALDEIALIEDEFAKAAVRVKEAGDGGVEIHAAHGYLLNQFLSPLTNFRTDAYGPQSIESRARIIVETVEKVRAAVGDFPISVRLGGCDYTEGGSTVADAAAAAGLIEKAGADMLSISGGLNIYMRPGHREPGWFSDQSSAVKTEIEIPVMLTGGIRTSEEAEKLLAAGAADIIGVGRAVLRNPCWGQER